MSDSSEQRASERLAEAEAERDEHARKELDDRADWYCQIAEVYLEKKREYEATHHAADGSKTHIEYQGFEVPLKFHQSGKNEGAFQRWPEYDNEPPGLYKVPSRGGYEYEVRNPYSLMLAILNRNGYRSVEAFLSDCQKGKV